MLNDCETLYLSAVKGNMDLYGRKDRVYKGQLLTNSNFTVTVQPFSNLNNAASCIKVISLCTATLPLYLLSSQPTSWSTEL